MKKIPTFMIVAFCLVWLGFAGLVYSMHDESSTSSALIWLAIGAGIVALYYLIDWYRAKKGIE